MYNFKNVGMTKDLIWFAKRYNALLVEFPNKITPEILKQDDVCSRYDPNETLCALKSAHKFLTSIAEEMLVMPEREEDRIPVLEKVFSKIDLFWGLGFYGELHENGNEYCFSFQKSNFNNQAKTLPSSYVKSFENITENGCYAEYFKGETPVKEYKSCDNGILHFDDNLIALGLYLYIKKVAQKRWYWEEDKAGNYTDILAFEPYKHCVEPYHRIDMRIFICGERLKYDISEQLGGYNDKIKKDFMAICDWVKENHPECVPGQGFWNYINCTVNFSAGLEYRILGGIGLGPIENYFVFYGSHHGKETEIIEKEVDFKGVKRDNNLGYSFIIENEADIKRAIHIMDLKAKHGKNIKPKSKEI